MPTFRTTLQGPPGSVGGRTAYGSVPSSIPTPPSTFAQLSGAVPNFPGLTTGTSGLIQSQQSGAVSPQTLNALKTGAAQFGIESGMPGSGLEANELFGNIAGFSENQQDKGIQNYLRLVGALGPTMTNPGLAAEISARNADLAAAPDPRLAAQEQFRLWEEGMRRSQPVSFAPGERWAGAMGATTPPIGATVGRSYYGGLPGGSDALGFSTYEAPYAGTTATLGAINPTGSSYNPNVYRDWEKTYGSYYPGATDYGGLSEDEYNRYIFGETGQQDFNRPPMGEGGG